MNRLFYFAGIALLVVAVSQPASSQNMRVFIDQVRGYLAKDETLRDLRSKNFQNATLCEGYIQVDGNRFQECAYDLQRGYVYAFVGNCDSDCKDMDLTLYDSSGRKVVEDAGSSDTPSVWTFTTTSGKYTLRVSIPKCEALNGCYWAVQAVSK